MSIKKKPVEIKPSLSTTSSPHTCLKSHSSWPFVFQGTTQTPRMCFSSLRKATRPRARPHKSAGQPDPGTHPSRCPKLQEKQTCTKMCGGEQPLLVSPLVGRKLMGRESRGDGGAGRAMVSGENRVGQLTFTCHLQSGLGSVIFIPSFNPTSGKGRNKD